MTETQIVLGFGLLGALFAYGYIQRRKPDSNSVIIDTAPEIVEPVVDVESVADQYLAKGQFEQAANLLLTTLSHDSSDPDLKMKLIEVYFISGDADTFVSAVNTFRGTLSKSEQRWRKVKRMAAKLVPQESLS